MTGQQHDYRSCRDRDCERPYCRIWREAWREGYEHGWGEGFEAGAASAEGK